MSSVHKYFHFETWTILSSKLLSSVSKTSGKNLMTWEIVFYGRCWKWVMSKLLKNEYFISREMVIWRAAFCKKLAEVACLGLVTLHKKFEGGGVDIMKTAQLSMTTFTCRSTCYFIYGSGDGKTCGYCLSALCFFVYYHCIASEQILDKGRYGRGIHIIFFNIKLTKHEILDNNKNWAEIKYKILL